MPIISYLIDRYSNYSTIILWICLLLEVIIEIASITVPSQSYIVIGLLCAHSICNTVEMNAIWKTFKQMVSFDETTSNLEQHATLNSVFVFYINIYYYYYYLFC